MAASLLDQLSQLVTPNLVNKASAALGESEGAITRGLGAVLPLLLGGISARSSDSGFMNQLFNLVQDPVNDAKLLDDPTRLLGAGAASSPMMALGGRLLSSLFGGNLGAVGNALAGHAGVRPQSASSLLSAAAPLVLGVLGKAVRSGGLNLSSLGSLLSAQKPAVAAALPPGFSLDRYLAEPQRVAPAAAPPPPPAEPERSIWRWIIPILVILALLLLLSRCFKHEEPVQDTTTPAPSAEVTPAPAPPPVMEPAPEAAPATGPIATLYFDTGAAALPADAAATLQPVVDHLNANPTAMAVVSGYHDPTGDAAVNEELAKNRAQAVRDALVGAGIPETRIDLSKPFVTEGSGSLEAARRVEVTVR